MTMSPVLSPDRHQTEFEIGRQIASVVRDLEDLERDALPGRDAEACGRICDRLAEELAEVGAMIRLLPRRPSGARGHTFAAVAALATAARREPDFAGWLMSALSEAAVRLDRRAARGAGQPCWDAARLLGVALLAGGENGPGLVPAGHADGPVPAGARHGMAGEAPAPPYAGQPGPAPAGVSVRERLSRIGSLDLEPVVFTLTRPEPGAGGLPLGQADEDAELYR